VLLYYLPILKYTAFGVLAADFPKRNANFWPHVEIDQADQW
jgi:hypothetical protein